MRPTVLFIRRFRGLTGGHLKARDYFDHVAASQTHDPRVWFTPDSVWQDAELWRDAHERVVASRDDVAAGAVFLGGLDWTLVRDDEFPPDVPVVNLIQHVRHAVADDPRRPFLGRRAIRICVSAEVAAAIEAAGARGPVIAIPNGVDVAGSPPPAFERRRDVDVVVAGAKRPELATRLAKRLKRWRRRVVLLTGRIPREQFLDHLRNARVAAVLPHATEGFFLPALESMALGAVTVVPDCVGNRSFCRDGVSALVPPADEAGLADAVERALAMDDAARARLLAGAADVAAQHTLERERRAFLAVLSRLDELWTSFD